MKQRKLSSYFPCRDPCIKYLTAMCENGRGCSGNWFLPCDSGCVEYKTVGELLYIDSALNKKVEEGDTVYIKECDKCKRRLKCT